MTKFSVHGIMILNSKSALLADLEKFTEVEPRLPLEVNAMSTTQVIDGMLVLAHLEKWSIRASKSLLLHLVKTVAIVYIIFYKYDKPNSI